MVDHEQEVRRAYFDNQFADQADHISLQGHTDSHHGAYLTWQEVKPANLTNGGLGPFAVEGYYPIYLEKWAAEAASPENAAMEHLLAPFMWTHPKYGVLDYEEDPDYKPRIFYMPYSVFPSYHGTYKSVDEADVRGLYLDKVPQEVVMQQAASRARDLAVAAAYQRDEANRKAYEHLLVDFWQANETAEEEGKTNPATGSELSPRERDKWILDNADHRDYDWLYKRYRETMDDEWRQHPMAELAAPPDIRQGAEGSGWDPDLVWEGAQTDTYRIS